MFIYLHFRCLRFNPILSTPSQVWTHAAIHEFADSQFGHIFAKGPNREAARKSLRFALMNLETWGFKFTRVASSSG